MRFILIARGSMGNSDAEEIRMRLNFPKFPLLERTLRVYECRRSEGPTLCFSFEHHSYEEGVVMLEYVRRKARGFGKRDGVEFRTEVEPLAA